MSWDVVARKDYRDSVRSWWLWGLSAFFVVLVAAAAYIVRPRPGAMVSSNAVLNLLMGILVTTLVPLIALVMAYGSIVGERESGSIKLLLSLPHSRVDVVFGTLVGRSAAIATPIVVGFVLPALVFLAGPVRFDASTYLGFTLMTVLLGVVFVAIAVGFSAAVSSQRMAAAGAVGLYFVFVPLWGAIRFPLQLYMLGGGPAWLPISSNSLLDLLSVVNPTGAFKILANALLNDQLFATRFEYQLSALLMLLAWLSVPPLLGYLVFERADL